MKCFPSNIEEVIGFHSVKQILSEYCQSTRGAELAYQIQPLSHFKKVKVWVKQMQEMLTLKGEEGETLKFDFIDFEAFLLKIKIQGTFLMPSEFHEIRKSIASLESWTHLLQHQGENYPTLASLTNHIFLITPFTPLIDTMIDERGEVRNHASSELASVRMELKKNEQKARATIQSILNRAKKESFAKEESEVTIREGRRVIPIDATHKKRIRGFIHDESATGQTVYLEPTELLEINNQIQSLKYKEKREIIRLMTQLSDAFREEMPALLEGVSLLANLDLIHAKLLLMQRIDGIIPEIKQSSYFHLVNARHPLLLVKNEKNKKPLVPLSLQLDKKNRILVISGPNAGGKSVALKTIILSQYMAQSGLPIAAEDGSVLGFYHCFFVDIGDTQSIENELSTYSAHLKSMCYLLKNAYPSTFFCIDEFGKGTEPQFGGAIAGEILLEINKKNAVGVITTHYQHLKDMAEKNEGLINGAMKYNHEALEPLFMLELGLQGNSFAFEIATKMRLPTHIINQAKRQAGVSRVDYEERMSALERDKSKYQNLLLKLEKEQRDVHKLRKEYEALRQMRENERKSVISEAKNQAKAILDNANKQVETVIREIKETQAEKTATLKARNKLDQARATFEDKLPPRKNIFKQGDTVKLIGQDTFGIVEKIKGKQVQVRFGVLRSVVSATSLIHSKTNTPMPPTKPSKKSKRIGLDIHRKVSHFKNEVSIRGMRAEEAIPVTTRFLDEALLVGVDSVRVIHGKGQGILKKIVLDLLKDYPNISSAKDEHPDRGGAGVTVVSFK